MDPELERDIIRRIKNGDRNRFADLVDRYKQPVFATMFRMTGHRDDAEDLAQEAFVKAYESLRLFDQEKPFFPWLYTIALNLARNHVKRKQKLRFEKYTSLAETHNPDGYAPDEALHRLQQAEQLRRAMMQLPLPLREAVSLRFLEELTFDDIAAILGVSLSAAKMRVYRGLEKLSDLMNSEE
jgi:RNA polymerase sigma-70 factor (ECF subfamily)